MGKSYKKNPYCTDAVGKLNKRQANKRIRQLAKNISKDLFNGSYYKSLVESYDLRDYSWRKSERQAVADWEEAYAMGWTSSTKEEALADWAKWYKRK